MTATVEWWIYEAKVRCCGTSTAQPFQDHDVLMLYEPQFDGIDDPEGFFAVTFNTVNLHPTEWFVPFIASDTTD